MQSPEAAQAPRSDPARIGGRPDGVTVIDPPSVAETSTVPNSSGATDSSLSGATIVAFAVPLAEANSPGCADNGADNSRSGSAATTKGGRNAIIRASGPRRNSTPAGNPNQFRGAT